MKVKQITFHNKDGSTYQGAWKNGLPHGKGVLIDTEGAVFEGTFVDGKPTDGTLELEDGNVYQGSLNDLGMLHGTGTIIEINGARSSGTFVNNEPHGVFEILDENGNYSTGEFKHSQKHGMWYEEESDGSKWDVIYEKDEIVASRERKIELVPDK